VNRTGASGLDRRDAALAGLCAALALWSYRWALGSYFSPDDLIMLERARGLVPWPDTMWRILSGRLYFETATALFGTNALAFLRVNWLLHGLNTALLFAFVRRVGGSRLAATIAAALFASSRLFLSAFPLTGMHRAAGWIAALPFALAVLAKESVMVLPLAFLFLRAAGRDFRTRLVRVAPLIGVSAAWLAYLVLTNASATVYGGPAYERGFGMQVVRSLGLYARWVADYRTPAPDFPRPATDGAMMAEVLGLLIVAFLAWLARRGAPLVLFGIAWFVLGLATVLPLVHQHNLYYLYVPFGGVAIVVGATFGAIQNSVRKRAAPGRADLVWWSAAILVLAHVVVSDVLMRKRVRDELWEENVPYDPFVRKIELIRRMDHRVAGLAASPGTRLVVVVPRIDDRLAELFRGLLPGVVDQGRGLRALHPNVDSVAFVDRWTPAYRDFQLVAGSVDGLIQGFGTGPESHLRFAGVLVANGFIDEARQHLGDASAGYPDDPRLQRALAMLTSSTAQPMPQSSSRPSSPPIR